MAGLLDLITQRAPTQITPLDTRPPVSGLPAPQLGRSDLTDVPNASTEEETIAAGVPTIQHSWEAGVSQTSSMLKNAVAGTAQALGSTDFSARMRQSAMADSAAAEQSMQDSHAVQSLKDVNGLGDFGNYLGHSVIRNAPQLGVMAAGALATRGRGALGQTLGTAAPSAAMNFGGTYDEGMQAVEQGLRTGQYTPEQAGQLQQRVLTDAAVAAPIMAALDTLGFSTIFKTGPMRQSVAKAITSSLPAHMRNSILAEGVTEAAQEYVQKTAVQLALNNPEAFGLTPDDQWRLMDAFVQGGAAGGAFATPGHLAAPVGAAARWAGQNVVNPALHAAGRAFAGRADTDTDVAAEGAALPAQPDSWGTRAGAFLRSIIDAPTPEDAYGATKQYLSEAFSAAEDLPVIGPAIRNGRDAIAEVAKSQRLGRAKAAYDQYAGQIKTGFDQFVAGYQGAIDPSKREEAFNRYQTLFLAMMPKKLQGIDPATAGERIAGMVNGFNESLLQSAVMTEQVVDTAQKYAPLAASVARSAAQGVKEGVRDYGRIAAQYVGAAAKPIAGQLRAGKDTAAQGLIDHMAELKQRADAAETPEGKARIQSEIDTAYSTLGSMYDAVAPVAKDLGTAAANVGETAAIVGTAAGRAAGPAAKVAAKATAAATGTVRDFTAGAVDGIAAYERDFGKLPEEPPPPDDAPPPAHEAAGAARNLSAEFAKMLGVEPGLVDADGKPLKKAAVDSGSERIIYELLTGKKGQPWTAMAPNVATASTQAKTPGLTTVEKIALASTVPLTEARELARWLARMAENPRLVQQVLSDPPPAVTNEMVRLTGYTPREVFGYVFKALRDQGADTENVSGDSMEGQAIYAAERAQEQRAAQEQEQAADEGDVTAGHELTSADIEASAERPDEYGDQGVNDRVLEEETDVAAGDAAAQRFEAALSKQDPREDSRKEFGGKAWVLKMTQLIDPDTGEVVSKPNITPHRINLVNLRKQSRFSRTLEEDKHLELPEKILRDFSDAVADLFNGWTEDVVGQDGKTYIKKVSIFPGKQMSTNGKVTALPRKNGLERWISDDAVIDTSGLSFGDARGESKAAPRYYGAKLPASFVGAMDTYYGAPEGKEKRRAETSLAIDAAGYLNAVVPLGNDSTGATRQEALDAYNATAEYVGNAKAPPAVDKLHDMIADARASKATAFVERILGRMQQAVQQNSLQPFSEGEAVDPVRVRDDGKRLLEMAQEPTEAELDAHVGHVLRNLYDYLQKNYPDDGQVLAAIRLLPTEVLQNQQAKIEERLEKIYSRQILQPFVQSEQETSVDNPAFNKGRLFADETPEFGTKPASKTGERRSARLRRDYKVAQLTGADTAPLAAAGAQAVADERAAAAEQSPQRATVTRYKGTGYTPRTQQNIDETDATVALALNFDSPGERATKARAEEKNKYIGVNLRTKVDAAAAEIVAQLKARNAHTVNIAGNGISSLLQASSQKVEPAAMQKWVDDRVLEILRAVHEKYPLQEIRSGGQTGVDEAGIKAAEALGIPSRAVLPKGYTIRDANEKDWPQTWEQTMDRLYPNRRAMAPEATVRPAEATVADLINTRSGENPATRVVSPKAPFNGDRNFNPAAPTTGSAPPSGDTKSAFSPKKEASSDLSVEQLKAGKVGSTPNTPTTGPQVASAVPQNLLNQRGYSTAPYTGPTETPQPRGERPTAPVPGPAFPPIPAIREALVKSFSSIFTKTGPETWEGNGVRMDHLVVNDENAEGVKALDRWAVMRDGDSKTARFLPTAEDAARLAVRWAGGRPFAALEPLPAASGPAQTFLNKKAKPPRRRVDTAEIEAERGSPYMTPAETAAAVRAVREARNPVMDPNPDREPRLDPGYEAADAYMSANEFAAPEVAAKRPKGQAAPRSGASKASRANIAGGVDLSTEEGKKRAIAEIRKIAGDVGIRFLPEGHPDLDDAAAHYDPVEHVITLAANPNGALGTGYHEALHAIFRAIDPQDRRELNLMLRHNAKLRGWIKEKLKDFPEAQYDAMHKPEEMAAYAFQFWKTDPEFKALMSPVGNRWFQKIENFIHHVWAWMRGQASADEIFQRIADGLYSQGADHAANVLAKEAAKKGRIQQVANAAMRGYEVIWDKLLRSMDDRLRDVGIDELTAIAQKLYAQTGEQGERGLAQAIQPRIKKFMNRLSVALGPDAAIAQRALESMANGTTESAEVEKIKKQVRSFLDAFHQYVNGPRTKKVGYVSNFLPMQWSGNKIEAKKTDFIDMLYQYEDKIAKINEELKEHYVDAHGTEEGYKEFTPESIAEKMLRRNREERIPTGGVLDEYGVPTAHHAEDRVFKFLTNADRRPFIEDNHLGAMHQYIKQMVRNTEYIQRFGEGGIKLRQMKDAARNAGATWEQLRLVDDAIDNIFNVRYDNADPMLRFAGAWIQTYQNYRVLGLSVLSSIIDPLALAVRTQEFGEAWDAYKYAISNIVRGEKPTALQQLAEDIGAIEREGVMSSLADMYGGFEDEKETKKLNDMLFTYNGMNGLTRALREFALGAGIRFISKHARNVDPANSDRWIRELGISPADVKFKPDGTLMIKQRDFMRDGMDKEAAQVAATKIQDALLRFIDESVLAPNAMERPNWGSDPLWGLVFHLKQYLFSFQKVVGRRIVHEVEMQDSDAPLLFAAPFIPVMAASGLVRDLITHGGSLPPDAGFMHYLTRGFDRVGFQGPTDIPLDVASDLVQGRNPMKTVGGPTLEQALEGLEVIGSEDKVKSLWKWIVEGMPGQSVYRRALT